MHATNCATPRTALSVVWLALLTCSGVGLAEENFPYLIEITAEQAVVRSGPGEEYYGTDELPRGSQVEVYRRGPGEWLAIRPPAPSFSWVESSKIRLTDDPSLGEVIGLQTVSWIGSNLADVEDHRWLVQLKKGEIVEIAELQRLTIHTSSVATTYYRIAPPAGEFRWVRAQDVRGDGFQVRQASAEPDDSQVVLSDFRVVVDEPADEAEPRRDGFVARRARRAPAPAVTRLANVSRTAPAPAEPTARSTQIDDAAFKAELKDLDLQLALAVTKPPESWELDSLRDQIESLAEQASSTVQRGRAGIVLDKLSEFESLQQRYLGLQEAEAASSEKVPSGPAPDLAADVDADTAIAIDPRFDGKGWLLPVHSTKRESPPYALLDSDGNILQFVSPAPGLNLHRYLRKEVGIFGQRNYLPQLQKGHLTADRVISLDRHRR